MVKFLSSSIRSDQIDQSLSRVQLFATPWIAARQASLSITNSRSSPRLTSIESVMLSSHLILCCPLLLLPPIPPSIRVFSNESTLRMRWPKYWSFIVVSNCFLFNTATLASGDLEFGWHLWALGVVWVMVASLVQDLLSLPLQDFTLCMPKAQGQTDVDY